MDVGAATHTGYVRSGNEDGFFASGAQAVFAVADGMGGHAHGEVASHLALETIAHYADTLASASPSDLANELYQVIQDANTTILAHADTQDARNRMGTTLVLATVCGDRLYFAHIGDSRLYLLRGEIFTQLTRDHSLVQTMVDRGEISPEEAAIHPLRHQITRVVGGDNRVSPEIASQTLQPGDTILLCTDGLSGTTPSDTMRSILHAAGSAQEKSDALIQAALAAGGPDNITTVVVGYRRPHQPHKPRAKHPHARRLPLWASLLIGCACVVALLGGAGGWAFTHPQYLVATDAQDRVELYRSWPLLPPLARQPVSTDDAPILTLEDIRPYLTPYHLIEDNMHHGIRVEGLDAGIALIRSLAKETVSGLLIDAKQQIEQGHLLVAQAQLKHAKVLHADPLLLGQLQTQLQLRDQAHPATPLARPTP